MAVMYAVALGKENTTRKIATFLAHNGFGNATQSKRDLKGRRSYGHKIKTDLTEHEIAQYIDELDALTDESNIAPFPGGQ